MGKEGCPCLSSTLGNRDNAVGNGSEWRKNTIPKAILDRIAEKAFKVSFRERVEALCKGKKYA